MGRRLNDQGQGRSTTYKESAFGAALGYHMKLEAQFLAKLRTPVPYFHIDLNAGAGYNAKANIVGTPELFITQAKKHSAMMIRAFFIEKHRKRSDLLCQRLRGSGLLNGHLFGLSRSFDVRRIDNQAALASFVDAVGREDRSEWARGSIISDPNGWSSKEGALDLAVARDVLAKVPNFMLLVSFFWSRAKAMRGYHARGEGGPIKNVALRRVSDHLNLRKHWLISEPAGQFCYLCGTNRPYPEWQRPDGWRGWVKVDSSRGRELLHYYDDIQADGLVA